MSTLFINILESSATMALFYVFFYYFLRKETHFSLNRWYLLFSILFSVTIPFINFNTGFFQGVYSENGILGTLGEAKKGYNEIGAVVVYAYAGIFHAGFIKQALVFIYIIGVFISASFFIYGIGNIIYIVSVSKTKKAGKYRILETSQSVMPFSLFKWIIINPEKYSAEEMEQIIAHEKMHAFQLHSFDLILIELLVILFWFNPFIYWYRKSIREVHEYQADQAVVESGFSRVDYQQLLFSQVTGYRFIGFANKFSYSLSKKRLKMLSILKSKNSSKIKVALAMPIAIFSIIFFINSSGAVNIPVSSVQTDLQEQEDTVIIKQNVTLDEVFYKVDVMPKFNGGDSDNFRQFIQEKLKYPEDAQTKKITGKVYVEFVIDKEGNIVNAKVIRGVSPSLDAEALRVVNLSPKWEPGQNGGKAVNVSYTMPIVFALK